MTTSLMRWSPFVNRWPSIFDGDDFTSLTSASNNLDVYETEDEVVVQANVAGVKPDDVEVTFEKGVLYVRADRTEEEDDKDKKHFSKSSWSYSYRVSVPGMIDEKAEPLAEVSNGVLEVKFKKAEASKPRKLTVKSRE